MTKKIWFIAYGYRLWIPVSKEAWMVLGGQIAFLLFILWSNGLISTGDRPFVLSDDWPILLEIALLIIATLWICKGHVDKRY